jgi:hypothetical protein
MSSQKSKHFPTKKSKNDKFLDLISNKSTRQKQGKHWVKTGEYYIPSTKEWVKQHGT